MAVSKKKPEKNFVKFTAEILRFQKMGEKTGWSYIEVPARIVKTLSPGMKKSFRVKGLLDNHKIKGVSLLPMGEGNFILPINQSMRKGTGKTAGAKLLIQIEPDETEYKLNKEMMICIEDEPKALEYFQSLTRSHQNYFSKWVDSAKSEETKANRIARIINALVRKMHYGEMLKAGRR